MIYLDHPYTLVDFVDYLIYDKDPTKSNPITNQVHQVTIDDELIIKSLLTLHGYTRVCFNGKSLDPDKSDYKDITEIETLNLEIRKFKLTASPSRSVEAEYLAPVNLFLVSNVSTNIAMQIQYYQDVEKTGGSEYVPSDHYIELMEECQMHWVDEHGIECFCLLRDELLLALKTFTSLHTSTGKYINKYKKNSEFYNTKEYWLGEISRAIVEKTMYSILGQHIFKHLPQIYTESESSFDITVFDDSNPDDPQDFTWHCTAIGIYAGIERLLMTVRNITQPQASVLVRGLIFDTISNDPYAARNIDKSVYYQVVQFMDAIDYFLKEKLHRLDFDVMQIRLCQFAMGLEDNSSIFKVHTGNKKVIAEAKNNE